MSALQDVAISYLERKGSSIPFWEMATTSIDELKRRADKIYPKYTTETTEPQVVELYLELKFLQQG